MGSDRQTMVDQYESVVRDDLDLWKKQQEVNIAKGNAKTEAEAAYLQANFEFWNSNELTLEKREEVDRLELEKDLAELEFIKVRVGEWFYISEKARLMKLLGRYDELSAQDRADVEGEYHRRKSWSAGESVGSKMFEEKV